jgi:DNA-binding transcriptional ArsR family regulator
LRIINDAVIKSDSRHRNIAIDMGSLKEAVYNERHVALADAMKALGHPARLAIVEFLLERSTCMCGDIVEYLPLSQATVSQHLKALKEAGIIQGTIEGRRVCYCVNPDALEGVISYLKPLNKQVSRMNKNCC